MKHEHTLDAAGAEKALVLGRGASFEDTAPRQTVRRWMDDYGSGAALAAVRLL